MADFYTIHRKSLEAGAVRYPAPHLFRVIMWEPIGDPNVIREDETCTIITFRAYRQGDFVRYEPADLSDRLAIVDFNERHKHTPASAWNVPDFRSEA